MDATLSKRVLASSGQMDLVHDVCKRSVSVALHTAVYCVLASTTTRIACYLNHHQSYTLGHERARNSQQF